ncbi:hypothetical protein [Rickettsia helvetica]|uniref:ATP-dependent DNA helicase n=1 Tax=Rickettsia helvetica TaxID=35789 RepID=A0ABM9NCG5_RICHE|nr:hypothetical protein [Rickettsia endosymbiont of Ixodes ricinus]MCZ6896259.1 hypothetical protein [Rickettsia endosymbiont of Ixodes ricinus]
MTNKVNNMIHSKELLNSILRQDFHSFIIKVFNTINPGTEYYPSKHIRIITDYLNAVQSGEINRLIINIPPRSLKSICVSGLLIYLGMILPKGLWLPAILKYLALNTH